MSAEDFPPKKLLTRSPPISAATVPTAMIVTPIGPPASDSRPRPKVLPIEPARVAATPNLLIPAPARVRPGARPTEAADTAVNDARIAARDAIAVTTDALTAVKAAFRAIIDAAIFPPIHSNGPTVARKAATPTVAFLIGPGSEVNAEIAEVSAVITFVTTGVIMTPSSIRAACMDAIAVAVLNSAVLEKAPKASSVIPDAFAVTPKVSASVLESASRIWKAAPAASDDPSSLPSCSRFPPRPLSRDFRALTRPSLPICSRTWAALIPILSRIFLPSSVGTTNARNSALI